MDPTKLTVKAQEALATAAERARITGNPELTPLHLLAGLLAEQGSVAETLLRGVGADTEALRRGNRIDAARAVRARLLCRVDGGAPGAAAGACACADGGGGWGFGGGGHGILGGVEHFPALRIRKAARTMRKNINLGHYPFKWHRLIG
jgi:hypothetical protein